MPRSRISPDIERKILALRAEGHGVVRTAYLAGCGVSAVQRVEREKNAPKKEVCQDTDSKRYTLDLSTDDALRALAARTGRPMGDLIREAVADLVAKNAPEPPAPSRRVAVRPNAPAKPSAKSARAGPSIATLANAVGRARADLNRTTKAHASAVQVSRSSGSPPPFDEADAAKAAQRALATAKRALATALKKVSPDQRRRRLRELHPDKIGRPQTPAELAEYSALTA